MRKKSLNEIHLKMLSAKWWPFCLGLNILISQSHSTLNKHPPTIQRHLLLYFSPNPSYHTKDKLQTKGNPSSVRSQHWQAYNLYFIYRLAIDRDFILQFGCLNSICHVYVTKISLKQNQSHELDSSVCIRCALINFIPCLTWFLVFSQTFVKLLKF